MIEAQHEHFQTPGAGIWNDSHFFSFFDHANAIEVLCKIGVLPNQKRAHAWLVTWKAGKVVDYVFDWDLPLPGGDMHDLKIGIYHIRMVEPLKSFNISARTATCEINLLWEGIMPVFDFCGDRAVTDTVAPHHYQQAGRVAGTIRLGGSAHQVDGYGYRDRSWGERDFSGIAEYKAIQGQLGGERSFMGMKFRTRQGALFSAGYFFEHGQAVAIADMEVRISSLAFGTTSKERSGKLVFNHGSCREWNGKTIGAYGLSYGQVIAWHEIVKYRFGSEEGWGWLEEGATRQEHI